jgi:hypothetical protein
MIQTEYKIFIEYLIKLIDEIGDLIQNNKIYDKNFFIKLSVIIFNQKYRIHLGILLIFISFFLYIIDII